MIAGGNTPLGTAIYSYASKTARETSGLHQNRWYGTMTILADGRPLVVGGVEPYVSGFGSDPDYLVASGKVGVTPEIFDPATGWTLLDGATSRAVFGPELNHFWYPRQWVAADGRGVRDQRRQDVLPRSALAPDRSPSSGTSRHRPTR